MLGSLTLAFGDWLMPGGLGSVVGRTCFIDRALRSALKEGVDQLVILGAGHDCRAYRLPELARVPIFEVDHPDTQARKREVIERLETSSSGNVRHVAIDFDRDSLATVMARSGFISGALDFFIWEGVTQYLRPESVDATLRYVVDVSRPGSWLAFTYTDLGLIRGTKHFAGASRLVRVLRGVGEPFLFGIDPLQLGAFLEARGLELVDDVTGRGYAERYFAPGGRQLSANEHEHAAIARVRG